MNQIFDISKVKTNQIFFLELRCSLLMHMQKISQTNDTEVSRVDIFLFTKLSTMISRQKKI